MRYVLHYSSIFDNPKNIYDIGLFKRIIKENGGKNIRTAYNHGWSNQPRIVTFNTDNVDKIKISLDKLSVFRKWGCLIFPRN